MGALGCQGGVILPFSAIEKLLKFIQISYGYRKVTEILKAQV
jgi:hypothetical protein